MFEEFVLDSLNASPLMKPLLTSGQWHEEKFLYWNVSLLGNVCSSSSDFLSNLLFLLTTTSFGFRYFSREFSCRLMFISSFKEFGHFFSGGVSEGKKRA